MEVTVDKGKLPARMRSFKVIFRSRGEK